MTNFDLNALIDTSRNRCPVLTSFLRLWLAKVDDGEVSLAHIVGRLPDSAVDEARTQVRAGRVLGWFLREYGPAWFALVPETAGYGDVLAKTSSLSEATALAIAAGEALEPLKVQAGSDAAYEAARRATARCACEAAYSATSMAAREPMRDAAFSAARVAASRGIPLEITVARLQRSAVELLERLLTV